MIEFKDYSDVLDFTGICKILSDDKICYYINGILQQKIDASSGHIKQKSLIKKDYGFFYILKNYKSFPTNFNGAIMENHTLRFYKNGYLHREDGPAIMNCKGGQTLYYYKGCDSVYYCFKYNINEKVSSNEDWKRIIQFVERSEELSIFK